MTLNKVVHSDNIEFIETLPDNSIDAIVTDSPYGLSKEPDPVLLLKAWLEKGYYEVKGKGFMGKSWDAFVPQPALWKQCYRVLKPGGHLLSFFGTRTYDWGTLAIRLAGFEIRDCIQWIYGSGFPKSKAHLKPANEPICVARKPGAIVALNIDEYRIEMNPEDTKGRFGPRQSGDKHAGSLYGNGFKNVSETSNGRWPSNVIFDEEMATRLDEESGILNKSIRKQGSIRTKNPEGNYNTLGAFKAIPKESYNDFGGASRFFYVAKASPSERKDNPHPTVKPIKLMRQLAGIYCPKGGVCLDPHGGSGSTALGCIEAGVNFILIDNDIDSVNIARRRINNCQTKIEI